MIEFDAHDLAISSVETLHEIASDLSSDFLNSSYGTAMNAVLASSLAAYGAAGMTPAGLLLATGWGFNHLIDANLIDRPDTQAATISCILSRAREHGVDTNTLVYCIDHGGRIPEALLDQILNEISATAEPETSVPGPPPIALGVQRSRADRVSTRSLKQPQEQCDITTSLNPRIDHSLLKLHGWDIRDVNAMLESKYIGRGQYSHRVELTGSHGFNAPLRRDSFSTLDGWPVDVVAIVRADGLSTYSSSFQAFFPDYDNLSARRNFSSTGIMFDTYQPLDHSKVDIEIKCFDAYDGGMSRLPLDPVTVPHTIMNTSSLRGVQFSVNSCDILMHRSQTDYNEVHGNILMTGSLIVGRVQSLWVDYKSQNLYVDTDAPMRSEAPFEIRTPTVEYEFVASDGSYLWSEELDVDMAVPVDKSCRGPSRNATWFVDKEFDSDIFVSPPARAIIRISDPL